jgi:hypothetical protein
MHAGSWVSNSLPRGKLFSWRQFCFEEEIIIFCPIFVAIVLILSLRVKRSLHFYIKNVKFHSLGTKFLGKIPHPQDDIVFLKYLDSGALYTTGGSEMTRIHSAILKVLQI